MRCDLTVPTTPSGSEFFDLRERERCADRARAVTSALRSTPQWGVLDVGAGTGIASAVYAAAWPTLPVWALEPSRSLRTALLTSLALRPDLRHRITVVPVDVVDYDREGYVDLATVLSPVALGHPDRLRPTVAALHRALVPGGHLVVETPPGGPGREPEYGLSGWCRSTRVGEHRIDYHQETMCGSDGMERALHTYTWRDPSGRVLFEESDEFVLDPRQRCATTGVLAEAGFDEVSVVPDRGGHSSLTVYRRR